MIAGIILSAGASRRMGTPKALLDYHGETFVSRLVRVMSLSCDSVTVVLGNQIEAIRPHIPNRARVVINPDPDRGQLSSLQCALLDLPSDARGFAFIPVDCPAVAEDTVAALAQTFATRDAAIQFVIPRRIDAIGNARRGHPVFATRAIAQEFLALKPTAEAREIVHRHVQNTQYLNVEDEGIFADIDTPEAYQQWIAGPASRGMV